MGLHGLYLYLLYLAAKGSKTWLKQGMQQKQNPNTYITRKYVTSEIQKRESFFVCIKIKELSTYTETADSQTEEMRLQ